MALHCPDHSLLCAANPRSGSTAVCQHLLRHYGGRFVPPQDLPATEHHGRIRSKHSNLADLRQAGLFTRAELARLHTFAILRDPREIALTWYYYHRAVGAEHLADPHAEVHTRKHRAEHMRIALEEDFPTWVEKVIGSGIYSPYHFSRCANGVDVILRHEHLEADFAAMLKRWGIPAHGPIQPANVTPGRAGEEAMTPRAREIIEHHYAEHLEAWRALSE